MNNPRWERRLWGVRLSAPRERDVLLGEAWNGIRQANYEGQPMAPLLFTTRESARKWCMDKREHYAQRTDRCTKWKFTPVRVRLLVTATT